MSTDVEEWDELDQIIVRRSKRPNVDQRENYLELLADGVPHVKAAHDVGSTGRAFRSLRRNDVHFAKLCEQAEKDTHQMREDYVRSSMWEILYDKDHAKHWEAVRFAAEVYLQETEYKRIKQVHKRIDMESALAATLSITVESLRALPEEELDGLIVSLEKAGATPALRAVE